MHVWQYGRSNPSLANKGDHVRSCTEVDDYCIFVVQRQDSISARTEIRQH